VLALVAVAGCTTPLDQSNETPTTDGASEPVRSETSTTDGASERDLVVPAGFPPEEAWPFVWAAVRGAADGEEPFTLRLAFMTGITEFADAPAGTPALDPDRVYACAGIIDTFPRLCSRGVEVHGVESEGRPDGEAWQLTVDLWWDEVELRLSTDPA